MKIPFKRTFAATGKDLVRKCGYGEIYDKKMDRISYVKRLRQEHFPRFHMYINSEDPLELDLHLDQKKASYEGSTMHSGDYDSQVVRDEAYRIWQIVEKEQ